MKHSLTYFFLILIIFSCKNEEKTQNIGVQETKPSKELEVNNFEKSLLSLKDVNVKFNDSFKIKRFGAKKKNDSVYALILRLDENVTEEQVKKYSIGLRSYSFELNDSVNSLKRDFSPKITKKQGAKYIILNQKINGIRYFDSIEAYIYKRRDWKASGRLGTIIIKDILLEEKDK
ncbi:hypothetical protein [Hanstruepera flava]|uniref:hypothetical protein n=1 Tax=Hanstruepera flava TaxID=2930218 RepID=UPI002028CA89|nr:hypothetical protein [Hanstruepera flava]